MARFHGRATRAGISTGTSAKTLIQLVAPSNHRVALTGWKIGFHGTNNTHEPIKVDVLRQTTAGTMTSLTPVKADDSLAETLQTTAQHTATAEPTAGDVLDTMTVHPQTSYTEVVGSLNEILIGGGDRVGLRVTAGNDVNADVTLMFEE